MWKIERTVAGKAHVLMTWEFESKRETEEFIIHLEDIRTKVPVTYRAVEIVED